MDLTNTELRHIAKLSRIEMNEDELVRFGEQITDILNYVGQLNEVDTSNVEPTARVTDTKNIWREDKVKICNIARENLLINAPEVQDSHIKVKAVLE